MDLAEQLSELKKRYARLQAAHDRIVQENIKLSLTKGNSAPEKKPEAHDHYMIAAARYSVVKRDGDIVYLEDEKGQVCMVMRSYLEKHAKKAA